MSNYRRSTVPGGIWFFTLTLADRRSRLLVEKIALLRQAYGQTQRAHPFHTLAICILPDHLHAIWTLPKATPTSPAAGACLRARSRDSSRQASEPQAKPESAKRASGSGALGTPDPRRRRPAAACGLRPFQSAQARASRQRCALAAFELSPVCRQGPADPGLGWQ